MALAADVIDLGLFSVSAPSETVETDAGTFVLERQQFTESAWQFLFNGRFIDTYASASEAARAIPRQRERLGLNDAVLLPPASLAAWEVHWVKSHEGDAPELWLHQMYLGGRQQGPLRV